MFSKHNLKYAADQYTILFKLIQDFKPDLVVCGTAHWQDMTWVPIIFRVPALAFNLSNTMTADPYEAPFNLPKLPFGMNLPVWRIVFDEFIKGYALVKKTLVKLSGRPDWEFFPSRSELLAMFGHGETVSFVPYCLCQDDRVVGRRRTDKEWFRYVGNLVMPSEACKGDEFGGPAAEKLEAFLGASDEPPVYLGWGSLKNASAGAMSALAVRALMEAGCCGVVLSGWGGLSYDSLATQPGAAELQAYCDKSVLFMESVDHVSLLPRCSVIVHHGGIGTTIAGLRSGRPNVVTPIFYDQFESADMINRWSGRGCLIGCLRVFVFSCVCSLLSVRFLSLTGAARASA